MTQELQITQADRDAAKAAFNDCTFLQVCEIFARHRQQSIAELLEALKAILAAETYALHVGYDSAPGGGNFVYADAVRTDDEAFVKARALLAKHGAQS